MPMLSLLRHQNIEWASNLVLLFQHLPQIYRMTLDLDLLIPNKLPFGSLNLESKKMNSKLDVKYQNLQK